MYAAVNLGRTSMDQAMVESQLPQCIVALGIGWGEADMLRNAASSLLVAILLRKEVSILTMLCCGEEGLLKQLCSPTSEGPGHRLVSIRVGSMITSIAPNSPTLQAAILEEPGWERFVKDTLEPYNAAVSASQKKAEDVTKSTSSLAFNPRDSLSAMPSGQLTPRGGGAIGWPGLAPPTPAPPPGAQPR